MNFRIIIVLSLILSACTTTAIIPKRELPNLRIKNQNANHLIVDRNPDYGYDGKEGCLVLKEISIDIPFLERDKSIQGKAYDAASHKPLRRAGIILTVKKKDSISTISILADGKGEFNAMFDGTLEKITIAYVAYRSIDIDFNRL